MIRRRAVFLDLNGTLVMPLKQESLAELTLIPGADLAVSQLIAAGFVCPVVTIQARIAKGLFTEQEFRAWFADFFGRLGLDLKGPYVCPHRYGQPCPCKKPSPMLYEQAARDLSIDLSQSYVVGDTAADVMAGRNFGGLGCLVRTGFGEKESEVEAARPAAAFIGGTLGEVAKWILRHC
jgi:D-glycero-D-manno-heptose 1,7-bisphosphate phosphatase